MKRTALKRKTPLKAKSPLKRKSKLKPKKKSQVEKKAEKIILSIVEDRDESKCQVCGKQTNYPPHHIIQKGDGGRGVLKELIDCEHLRIQLCEACHYRIHHQAGGANPFYFYQLAIVQDYYERIILMELLIDEWAGWIPEPSHELAHQIRARNKTRWRMVFGGDITIYPDIIATHWKEILGQEVIKS